jgi:hypothetical protein
MRIMLFGWFKRPYKNLEQHPFFSTVNYWINIEIDNLNITNIAKRNVVRAFLKLKFTVFNDRLKEYIRNNVQDEEICTDGTLCIGNLVVDCLKEYEDKARTKGVPDIFIDKFRQWHDPHTDITFESIRSVCESKFYTTNVEKIAAVLDILLYSFRMTIIDAERTINQLNGELEAALKGTIYDF